MQNATSYRMKGRLLLDERQPFTIAYAPGVCYSSTLTACKSLSALDVPTNISY